MNYLFSLLLFILCFSGMAVGVIFAKKVLKKRCGLDPSSPDASCGCKSEEDCKLKDTAELTHQNHQTRSSHSAHLKNPASLKPRLPS